MQSGMKILCLLVLACLKIWVNFSLSVILKQGCMPTILAREIVRIGFQKIETLQSQEDNVEWLDTSFDWTNSVKYKRHVTDQKKSYV